MSTEIQEFAITFGVQYGRREDAEQHPLGMHGDEYAVIEAPNVTIARKIAFAVFDEKWGFIYPLAEFLSSPRRDEWHPAGESLRIAWYTPDMTERILAQMQSLVEGHPSESGDHRDGTEAEDTGAFFLESARWLELDAEEQEPFLWDGKGSKATLAEHAHVHDAGSPRTCLKNRFGPLCTPIIQSGGAS